MAEAWSTLVEEYCSVLDCLRQGKLDVCRVKVSSNTEVVEEYEGTRG